MNAPVIVNGELRDGSGPVVPLDNRAFHYGDGLFESIRLVNGKPCFLDAHCLVDHRPGAHAGAQLPDRHPVFR